MTKVEIMARSKATDKQHEKMPGGITGKGFVKGDPRINRKGRPPANSAELNKLLDDIFAEEIPGGKKGVSKLRDALDRLLRHKNPIGTIHLLDRRYGKVSDKIDLSNSDGSLKSEMPVEQIAQRVVQLEEIARRRKEKNAR